MIFSLELSADADRDCEIAASPALPPRPNGYQRSLIRKTLNDSVAETH